MKLKVASAAVNQEVACVYETRLCARERVGRLKREAQEKAEAALKGNLVTREESDLKLRKIEKVAEET